MSGTHVDWKEEFRPLAGSRKMMQQHCQMKNGKTHQSVLYSTRYIFQIPAGLSLIELEMTPTPGQGSR